MSPVDLEDRPHVRSRHSGLIIFAVMLSALLQVLDTTIANVALPHMQSSLGATQESVTWVLTSYIVASAITLPAAGWLAGRFGVRTVLLTAVTAFIVLSMLCGMAVNLFEMIVFRIGQGIAGAFLIPLSQSVMLDLTRPSRHARMMGIWSIGIMIGPIMGPIVGGWLTENLDWRWVFYVNVPIGLISLFLLITQLPDWGREKVKFDLTGFALIAMALASLQLLLDRGEHISWFESVEAWIYVAILLSSGWAAVVHIIYAESPLFDHALFFDRNFVIVLLLFVVVGFCMTANMALLPPMLQSLLGYSVLTTGLVLAPRGVGVLISIPIAGWLVRRGLDNRVPVGGGLIVTAITMFEMATWSLAVDTRHIALTGIIQGLGLGLIFIPLNTLAFGTLPPRLRTSASSLLNLSRSLGASIGISLVITMLARNIQINHAELGSHITAESLPAMDLSAISRIEPIGTIGLTLLNAEINRQAAMIAYLNDFWLMGVFCLAALPTILLLRPSAHQDNY